MLLGGVVDVVISERYSVLQMSLIFYLDKPSYNHSIDFFWLPYNLGPVLCSTFCRFGWRLEEGHERWEANYY